MPPEFWESACLRNRSADNSLMCGFDLFRWHGNRLLALATRFMRLLPLYNFPFLFYHLELYVKPSDAAPLPDCSWKGHGYVPIPSNRGKS